MPATITREYIPVVLKGIQECNAGHAIAYGDDVYTQEAIRKFKEIFGEDTSVYFVFTGTAANVLGLQAITSSYHGIICASTAHIQVDECGAPEKFTGCKLIDIPTPDGKLTPELVMPYLEGIGFEHHVQPRVISITQVTELGTVYSVEEIKEIARFAHDHQLLLHMDGARLANAAVSLGIGFKEFTRDAGVDVLSFGGTKNGLMYGEAVLFFNQDIAPFKYIRKQGMQLASKMRYIAAQFNPYLADDLWLKNAQHANKMAALLSTLVKGIPGVELTRPTMANGVFATIPKEIIEPLQEKYFFYVWNEEANEVRWMTSYDTTEEDVRDFVSCIRMLINSHNLN